MQATIDTMFAYTTPPPDYLKYPNEGGGYNILSYLVTLEVYVDRILKFILFRICQICLGCFQNKIVCFENLINSLSLNNTELLTKHKTLEKTAPRARSRSTFEFPGHLSGPSLYCT